MMAHTGRPGPSNPGRREITTAASSAKINLIMSGGGVRLAAYVGAVSAFRDMGLQLGAIAGASAGSIIGAFLAAGWSPERMQAKILETDFARFKDLKLTGLVLEGGLYAGNVFEQWLDDALERVRFRDLPGDLFVIAVDLIGHEPFFFSRYTTPDLPVSRAVRCSMAIPWIWRPLRWQEKLLADGQLMPWLPAGIEMLEGSPAGAGATRTVTLRLLSDGPRRIADKRHLWPWDFALILLETMLTALDNQRVPGALWQDTILIRVGPIPPLRLRLSREAKEQLFRIGYEQAYQYFDKAGRDVRPGSDQALD